MPLFRTAAIALLPDAVHPDGDPLLPTDPALQSGRSTLCSFSPIGSGTPGTIYISDGIDRLSRSPRVWRSKVRLLRYDGGRKKWEER